MGDNSNESALPADAKLKTFRVGGSDGRERVKTLIVTGSTFVNHQVKGTPGFMTVLRSDSQYPHGFATTRLCVEYFRFNIRRD